MWPLLVLRSLCSEAFPPGRESREEEAGDWALCCRLLKA